MNKMSAEEMNALMGMTAAELEALCDAYDNDEIEFSDEDVFVWGSPLDYLEQQQRLMSVADQDAEKVKEIAAARGCTARSSSVVR